MIWFGLVLWHINHCRLFNAKSYLYIYIKYLWFGLVGFYGISTIVGYLMPNPLYTYICIQYRWFGLVGFYGISTIIGYLMRNPIIHIYWIHMIWFGWVLWHVNHCGLFNAKSSINIYIKYIWFVSTSVICLHA